MLFNLTAEIAADTSLLCPPSLVEPLATTQGNICNLRIQEIYLGFISCNQYDSTIEPNYFGCVDFFFLFFISFGPKGSCKDDWFLMSKA